MRISVKSFGTFGGERVDEAELTGADGVKISILNWGVVVRDWQVPTDSGMRQVVLGFDDFETYKANAGAHLGAVAGRVANRIGGASFTLDGKTYTLDANEGPNMLHGGTKGLGSQLWHMETDSRRNAVMCTLKSPDGAMGFPGNVDFSATYTLEGNTLTLDLEGVPDRPTPISLVQHIYFNLGTRETVLDHSVHLPFAVAHTEVDDALIPTGVILPVEGTPYDVTRPRTLFDATGKPFDFDLNYALATGRDEKDPIAIVTGEDDALTLKLWSDRPGLQFYNGVWTGIEAPGHGGLHYGKYSGFCLEDQMFPDALNNKHFPDIICTPDTPYRHRCAIEIA